MEPVSIGQGASKKGNVARREKRMQTTTTSLYLKYFDTDDNKNRRCKFCGKIYGARTATGNLGKHLNDRHPGYDTSTPVDASSSSHPVTVPEMPRPQPHVEIRQLELNNFNWLLVRWLIQASIPPPSLDEHWVRESLKILNPTVKLWPGEKFQTVLGEVFRSMQKEVRVVVDQVSSQVCITLDFWESYEKIHYMSITCQWIDENWSFRRVLLDICQIHSCCWAEISHALLKVLKLYNVDNRVLCCTYACHKLKEDMDNQKMSTFHYLPCAAHTLSSIIDDGLRCSELIVSKIRKFVLKMNTSLEISQDFLQCCSAYQEGNWKFPLDASSRWSGKYQMLDIARKASKSMETIVQKYDELLGPRVLLNRVEKNVLNITHAYLEPFCKTINGLCTNKVLTVGLFLLFMDHLQSKVIEPCQVSQNNPSWLKSVAEDMATKAQIYNDEVFNVFTYMTAILDPRIKRELIPESLDSEKYLKEAKNRYVRNYSTSRYAAQQLEDEGRVSFAEEIARKKREMRMKHGTRSSATDELTQYLSEPPTEMSTDVLEWWKLKSTHYPQLSVMARDFLAVQATALAPEDLFCSKGDEIDKQRFSTPYESTQTLHCVKSWMQGGFKLKYKSAEIDYENLMEVAGLQQLKII